MRKNHWLVAGLAGVVAAGSAAAWTGTAGFRLVSASATSAATSAAAGATVLAADGYKVDSGHTSVLFKVSHLGVTNFWGRFNKVTGAYTIDKDNPSASRISIDIDAESVDSNSAGRDRHLRSPDFFNTAQFPTATFRSTSVSGGANGSFDVEGDLTIRGVTKPVEFTLDWIGEGDRGNFGYRSGWETEVVINRSEFGVSYLPQGLGEEVTLVIAVEGIRE